MPKHEIFVEHKPLPPTTEVHEHPCAHCPSIATRDETDPELRDYESEDILNSTDKAYLLESKFRCAWRTEKLCKGWSDLVDGRIAQL